MRKPIVTRQMAVTHVRVELLDKLTGETVTRDLPIARHWNAKLLEKRVRECVPIRYKFLRIVDSREVMERFTLSEQDFIFAVCRKGGVNFEE